MSTKTSPMATTTTSSTPTTVTGNTVKIKKEIGNDEIKDFAETAMNELLGWYGYDTMDRLDLSKQASTTRLMNNLTTMNRIETRHRTSRGNHKTTTTTTCTDINDNKSQQLHHRLMGGGATGGDSTTSDPDTRSSREDSKSPHFSITKTAGQDVQESNCGWCRRPVPDNSPEFLTTTDGPRYCSESCFTQSRRASFKKAKTCDWCKHIRHAVSYVDFQDGASQLQFCSDKCLNQYKMQLFCNETQAHLDMNPHLKDKGLENNGSLITPDLWLKNCKSRSASPSSTISVSPTPPSQNSAGNTPQPSPASSKAQKPLISVASVAKLMAKSPDAPTQNSRQSPKQNRKRRPIRNGSAIGANTHSHLLNSLNRPKSVKNVSVSPSPGLPKQQTEGSQQPPRPNPPSLNFPPSFFSNNAHNFPLHPPFFPNFNQQRFFGMQRPPPIQQDFSAFNSAFGATPPPVTVMVPYPIILPLPIPIPVPIPMFDFLKAATSQPEPSPQENAKKTPEEPLDFTKSKSEEEVEVVKTPVASPVSADEPEKNEREEEKIPILKITRLQTKRLITKESECSRPLRKRKRLVDCEYLKITTSEESPSQEKEVTNNNCSSGSSSYCSQTISSNVSKQKK